MKRSHVLPVSLALALVMLALMSTLATVSNGAPFAETTPATTPDVDMRPDVCEPNDAPEQACVLKGNSSSRTFTILPDGDVDYYSFDLGAAPTGATTITVRGTSGLELVTTLTRAGETMPLTIISNPAISATVQADVVGWLVLRVENLAPGVATGETYRIDARNTPRTLTPDVSSLPGQSVPDSLENNYDAFHAAPIALNTIYDLNFTCPVVGACGGGDHDYLRVPVKAGMRYLVATFDLGPGTDTVLDLFWNDESQPLHGNDDYALGGLLSVLHYQAVNNGDLVVRVGPRNGGVQPVVDDPGAGSYRVIAALAESELAEDIVELAREQSNAPEPTSRPTTQSQPDTPSTERTIPAASSAPTPLAIANDAPTGTADVIAEDGTALREGPGVDHPIITTLPHDSIVALLGEAAGAWVRVQPTDSVVPGWVYGPALRPHTSTTPDSSADSGAATDTTTVDPNTPTAHASTNDESSNTTVELRVAREPEVPLASPVAVPRVPLTAKVHVLNDEQPSQPYAGLRVQLVNALGDVLSEVVTNQSGTVTFTRDIPPRTVVFVQVAAAGLRAPLDLVKPEVTITIPRGGVE